MKTDNTAERYPGVAVDIADNDKVTPRLVEEDVSDLNNNPRNSDGTEPTA